MQRLNFAYTAYLILPIVYSTAHSFEEWPECCVVYCMLLLYTQCGFSRLVVQILDMHGELSSIICDVWNQCSYTSGAKDYEFHDVLEDMDFKEGMKEYS